MRSEWRRWPAEAQKTWQVGGGEAHVIYPMAGVDFVEHDDGTWSPCEFTYVELPDNPSLPYFVVECQYSRHDLVPRVLALHIIQRDAERDVQSIDVRTISLEHVIETAWLRVSRRPTAVADEHIQPAEMISRDEEQAQMRRTVRGLRSRARRRVTDTLLEEVAEVYREARPSGAPTKAVKEHFGLATSTASLYVKRAREAKKNMGDETQERRGS